MKLKPASFPNQYNAFDGPRFCANVFLHGDRWYHDQGTCPDSGFSTKDEAFLHVNPSWRYVGILSGPRKRDFS